MALKPFTGTLDPPAGLTPYNGPLDGEEPQATAGGLIRSLAASALDAGIGYPLQAGGELLAAGLNKVTGTENFRAANPVGPISNLIREGMSGGDQLAAQDGFKGDVLAPATWEMPRTISGLAHQFAQGAGSLASMAVLGAAAVRAGRLAAGATTVAEKAAAEAAMRRAAGIGAVAGGATTAGAAADEVRGNLGRMSDEALYQLSPRFKELIDGGMDAGTARQTVENMAAQAAGAVSGVAGAASGALNARLLEDVIAKRGIPALIGGLSERGVVRAGVGAGLGALGEGVQETAEKVGQNVGENIGLGTPTARDLTRDTLGDFAGGFMVGGPIGALGRHASRASTMPPTCPMDKKRVRNRRILSLSRKRSMRTCWPRRSRRRPGR